MISQNELRQASKEAVEKVAKTTIRDVAKSNVKNRNVAKLVEDIAQIEKMGNYLYQATQFEMWVSQDLKKLYELTMELASGVTVQKETPDGPIVYKEKPDLNAIKNLTDRFMGKIADRSMMLIDADKNANVPTFDDHFKMFLELMVQEREKAKAIRVSNTNEQNENEVPALILPSQEPITEDEPTSDSN